MDKDRLLKYMQSAYANVEQAVAELNSNQLVEPEMDGDWSVKDLIAHLGYWMQREADRLKSARGEAVERYHVTGVPVDSINKIVYSENRDREFDEVMQNYRQAYHDLVHEVGHLADEDLKDTQRFEWTNGEPLFSSIATETFEHFNDHVAALRQYIRTVQGQSWPQA